MHLHVESLTIAAEKKARDTPMQNTAQKADLQAQISILEASGLFELVSAEFTAQPQAEQLCPDLSTDFSPYFEIKAAA